MGINILSIKNPKRMAKGRQLINSHILVLKRSAKTHKNLCKRTAVIEADYVIVITIRFSILQPYFIIQVFKPLTFMLC